MSQQRKSMVQRSPATAENGSFERRKAKEWRRSDTQRDDLLRYSYAERRRAAEGLSGAKPGRAKERRSTAQEMNSIDIQGSKNPRSCWNRNGDRHLNHYEKALFCIIQQAGPKSKEGIMPREKEGFREQLQSLMERFPGKEAVGLEACCEMLDTDRRILLKDKTFPAKKVGGKYMIPLVGLARWLC